MPVLVSAVTGEGIDDARRRDRGAARANGGRRCELSLDPADGAGLSWLHRHTEVLEKHLRDDGQLAVTVRADADKAARVRARFAAAH